MRIKIVSHTPISVKFVLEKANPALANAFRRALLGEVPVMAVDEVVFFTNTTHYFDEYVAHRLAMVPIRTDLRSYSVGDGKVVTLSLDRVAEEDGEIVYSGDLVSSDPVVIPANERIPIVKMHKGARIKLEAIVRMGKGKWHSKWQAVSGLGYSYYPIYRLRGGAVRACRKYVERCPDGSFRKEGGDYVVESYLDCPGLEDCIEVQRRRDPESVEVEDWDGSRFIMSFETTEALTIGEILVAATDELLKKFNSLKEKISNAEGGG